MAKQTCATCNQIGIIRRTTIYLGRETTRFCGEGASEVKPGYLEISMCARCRGKLDSAGFPAKIWFVVSGFLATLAALGAVIWAGMARDGGATGIGPAIVVPLLGLGTVGSLILYRREREKLRTRLVQWLTNRSSEEAKPDLLRWVKRLVESKGSKVALALLILVLIVSVGSFVGVVLWEAVEGITETVMASPKVFLAAIAGSVASMIGFVLLSLVLRLCGPTFSEGFIQWTAYSAPVIGGAIGAAIGDGLAINVIYIVALSALIGGITLARRPVMKMFWWRSTCAPRSGFAWRTRTTEAARLPTTREIPS